MTPEELRGLLTTNGFTRTETHSLAGGIATITLGYKPQ